MTDALARAFETLPGIPRAVYRPADFLAVRDIAYRAAGIVLAPGKAMLVYSRLAPLVRETGAMTFEAYIARIAGDEAERRRAVGALTTNYTFFFREAHHFAHLAQEVRPALVEAAGRGAPVRIWSAGCASGEECWSIVMTLLGTDRRAGEALAARDARVLATDIDDHALAAAEAARYRRDSIAAVPAGLRRAWLGEEGDAAIVGDAARAIARFLPLNLLGDWPMRRAFDVIFCRNVMIYFDHPTRERLVLRFAQLLRPGGHLYIGHSERVTGPAADLLTSVGQTVYRRGAA